MDTNEGNTFKRKTNPREGASFLSSITFFYTRSILKKGKKKDLDENDIYEILPHFDASKLGNRIEKEWNKVKNPTRGTLIKVLYNCFGPYYLLLGVMQLIMKLFVTFTQPWAVAKLVSYFAPNSTMPKSDAYFYGGFLIFLNLVITTYNHNYQLLVTELGIRVRTAVTSLLYRKSVRLNSSSLSDISIGKTVTLISKDIYVFDSIFIFLNDMWISVIQLIVTTVLIYIKLGYSTFAGVVFLLAIIPIQILLGRLTSKLRISASKITDNRIQITQELLSSIKIIKMYTWEMFYNKKIDENRNAEIQTIKKIYYTKATSLVLAGLVINITMYIIITTYTNLGNYFTAEISFYLLTCLQNLRSVIMVAIPLGIVQTAELLASIRRFNMLLLFKAHRAIAPSSPASSTPKIELKNVFVKYKTSLKPSLEKNDKIVLKNINVTMESGLNVITGPVGGGKSTLLKTILSEVPVDRGTMTITGELSYAPEEPWIFPATIRQNILFGEPYNKQRYDKVLHVCALQQDIETFSKGDRTVLDDRGMNLSKGQQTRICLARAIYKQVEIYLIDVCLTALDAHVQEYIFTECLQKFLKGKIVVVISHNERILQRVDQVLVMRNGILELHGKDDITPDMIEDAEITTVDDSIDAIMASEEAGADDALLKKVIKENIYKEEKQIGVVTWRNYKNYFDSTGSKYFVFIILILFVASQYAYNSAEKLVTKWTNIQQSISDLRLKNETNSTEYDQLLVTNTNTFVQYSYTVVAATVLLLVRSVTHFNICSRAARNLHNSMTKAVINAEMQFFDSKYIGNILNRFSRDIGSLDEYLPFVIYECLRSVFLITGIIILISTVNPLFLIGAVLCLIKMYVIRRMYIPVGRSLKRLDSSSRSPMIGHLNATLEGLTTIRALKQEDNLIKEFDRHQNLYVSTCYIAQCTNRAFAYMLDMVCVIFVSTIVLKFLIFAMKTDAGNVGLALSQAQLMTGLLQWTIRQLSELETQMTSVERVREYSDVKPENLTGTKPPNWHRLFASKIEYKDVQLTYGSSTKNVLQDVNFVIGPHEKIGIVGRTGAGKSSIISALFRLYDFAGRIAIDGVDIKTLPLRALRSAIAIIPQDPILFSGTLRSNIDPNGECDDERIWGALRKLQIGHLVQSLDAPLGAGFSTGQKQLVCLARAVVSQNKVIVLDEATANVDPETDAAIHGAIRETFAACTVLTIAHRLSTVRDSDKVMVVDRGQVIEFGAPDELLQNMDGTFYRMMRKAHLI